MKAGYRLRRQDRQAVVAGFGEGAVSRDGEEGDFAEGEGVIFPILASSSFSCSIMVTLLIVASLLCG